MHPKQPEFYYELRSAGYGATAFWSAVVLYRFGRQSSKAVEDSKHYPHLFSGTSFWKWKGVRLWLRPLGGAISRSPCVA